MKGHDMTLTAPKQERFKKSDFDAVIEALNQQELWPYRTASEKKDKEPSLWERSIATLENYYSQKSERNLRAVAASSGTAAIHVALGGLQIPAGTEVIMPPITDMGTVTPVISQNCIPVFADLDPETGLLSAETIEAKLTERTSAVIVVHLMGSPPDMDPIIQLCSTKGIKLIEDAAQALGATYKGKPLGTFGDAGAFSLNSQKHITAGEGGFVLVEGEETRIRCLNFSDKHRQRVWIPDTLPEKIREDLKSYRGVGLNYRMSDLEHALLKSQMSRLEQVAADYQKLGEHLENRMEGIDGITPQRRPKHSTSTYFYAMGRLTPELAQHRECIVEAMNKRVKGSEKLDVSVGESYGFAIMPKLAVFQNKNFFANVSTEASQEQLWPAELVARAKFPNVSDEVFDYSSKFHACPEAEDWLAQSILFRFHENHTNAHMDAVVDHLEKAFEMFS